MSHSIQSFPGAPARELANPPQDDGLEEMFTEVCEYVPEKTVYKIANVLVRQGQQILTQKARNDDMKKQIEELAEKAELEMGIERDNNLRRVAEGYQESLIRLCKRVTKQESKIAAIFEKYFEIITERDHTEAPLLLLMTRKEMRPLLDTLEKEIAVQKQSRNKDQLDLFDGKLESIRAKKVVLSLFTEYSREEIYSVEQRLKTRQKNLKTIDKVIETYEAPSTTENNAHIPRLNHMTAVLTGLKEGALAVFEMEAQRKQEESQRQHGLYVAPPTGGWRLAGIQHADKLATAAAKRKLKLGQHHNKLSMDAQALRTRCRNDVAVWTEVKNRLLQGNPVEERVLRSAQQTMTECRSGINSLLANVNAFSDELSEVEEAIKLKREASKKMEEVRRGVKHRLAQLSWKIHGIQHKSWETWKYRKPPWIERMKDKLTTCQRTFGNIESSCQVVLGYRTGAILRTTQLRERFSNQVSVIESATEIADAMEKTVRLVHTNAKASKRLLELLRETWFNKMQGLPLRGYRPEWKPLERCVSDCRRHLQQNVREGLAILKSNGPTLTEAMKGSITSIETWTNGLPQNLLLHESHLREIWSQAIICKQGTIRLAERVKALQDLSTKKYSPLRLGIKLVKLVESPFVTVLSLPGQVTKYGGVEDDLKRESWMLKHFPTYLVHQDRAEEGTRKYLKKQEIDAEFSSLMESANDLSADDRLEIWRQTSDWRREQYRLEGIPR